MTRLRSLLGRFLPALASAVLIAASAGVANPPAASAAASGFVTHDGTQLMLNGQPWHFAGYNLSCQQPFTMTTAQLEFYFQDVEANSGGNVIRMWFFQSDLGTGSNPFQPFDNVVAAAQATGMKIIPTLTNQWQTCDEPSPTEPEKELDWYQSGYTQPEGGYSLSFKAYATEMAQHFANSPTIAFWQLVNEAEAPSATGCDESAAASAMRGFADDMATTLHSVDPNHLVNLGTQGTGTCGTVGSDYGMVQAGAVDLCEIHDYSSPTDTLDPVFASDIQQCAALGKPTFVGESGIPGNVQPDGSSGSAAVTNATLAQRATFFKAKIDAFDKAGGVGYVIWFKSPLYTLAENNLDVPDGDPTQAVLADALTIDSTATGSVAPAASVPETPLAVGAPLAAAALIGGVVALRWRRNRRRAEEQLTD